MNCNLAELAAASAGPAPNDAQGPWPTMVTVGDSVMWGQGLAPNAKFRELVRAHYSTPSHPVVELSLARSGSKIAMDATDRDPRTGLTEADRSAQLAQAMGVSTPFAPAGYYFDDDADYAYRASATMREVPNGPLSIRAQLDVAQGLLGPAQAAQVKLVLLNGGINDMGVMHFASPLPMIAGALTADKFIQLLDQLQQDPALWTRNIDEAIATSQLKANFGDLVDAALRLFPNAHVVATGYFPCVTAGSLTDTALRDMLVTILGAACVMDPLPTLLSLKAKAAELDNFTRCWQAASAYWTSASDALMGGIMADRAARSPGRKVAYVKSNLGPDNGVLAPRPWLWGIQPVEQAPARATAMLALPSPADLIERAVVAGLQASALRLAEDQVVADRIAACDRAFTQPRNDYSRFAFALLASVGHPRPEMAADYAKGIITALGAVL